MEDVRILIASSLVLVATLAWNEAFRNFFKRQKSLNRYGPWVYAVLVTVICTTLLSAVNLFADDDSTIMLRLERDYSAGDASLSLPKNEWKVGSSYKLFYNSESNFVGVVTYTEGCAFDATALIDVNMEKGRYVWLKKLSSSKKENIRRYVRS